MTHLEPRGRSLIGVVLLAALIGGCAKKPPVVEPPPPPPLEVPVAPPRVLAPVAMPEPQPPEEEPPAEPAKPPRPRPARPAPTEPRPDAPKPETGEPVGPPVEAQRPPDAPAPALRTTQTADEAQSEKRVREVLARAQSTLERIDASKLGSDARAQFETARRFIGQSTDALKARNYMFAAYLADKAATLAAGLAGR